MILEELRADTRDTGRKLPRLGNAQRLFFAPIEPFLVDDTPERKHRGRISRACLTPIWEWIARDLMPQEAKTYVDQVNLLLAANGKKDAAEVARAFQDLAEQRMREIQATSKSDVKASRRVAAQIGTPQALEDVREIGAILRVRDALGVIASRLPPSIGNLADDQLDNVKTLLEFADRAPPRRFPLCAPAGDEPARLDLAADPPRHPGRRQRCGGAHRRDAVRRRGRDRARRRRAHDRRACATA